MSTPLATSVGHANQMYEKTTCKTTKNSLRNIDLCPLSRPIITVPNIYCADNLWEYEAIPIT